MPEPCRSDAQAVEGVELVCDTKSGVGLSQFSPSAVVFGVADIDLEHQMICSSLFQVEIRLVKLSVNTMPY